MTDEGTSTSSLVDVDQSVASKVPFGQLCQLFERVKKHKSNPGRRQELENFMKKWREHSDKLHSHIIADGKRPKDSFFPVMRLLLPQLDRARPAYGAKETMLAKLYIDALGLSRTNPDALKMLEYRDPKTNRMATGDFAEITYMHVLSKRCTTEGSLTIEEINEHLDKIAHYNNDKKKDMVQRTLMSIIRTTSASQQKWLIRILLKDMKLGLGQTVILNTFHKDAEELFNVTTNLEEVCVKLYQPSIELADAEIRLFMPFRPMLAFNAKLNEVENLMTNKEFRLEIKYDGERSQLHKNKSDYKYYSRSGKEYSFSFGENPYSGTLTPHIHHLFSPNVASCILDGEMMGYNPELKTYMQKGGQFDVKHIIEDSDLQPCFVAFDVLNLNGQNLTSEPLHKRVKLLDSIFSESEGRMRVTEAKNASTNQEVSDFLNEAIDRCEEGIIVKHPNSTYAPNKRRGSGWFKIKPDYVGGVVDDLDLVIVGGKFGSGRHANLINKFMLAVRDGDGYDAKYKSFSMVGSGYSNKELMEITETLKPHLKVFQKHSPPSWLVLARDKPEVTVHPENSIVVQVRAAEITKSSAYATGCTLRFPRIVKTRTDKTAKDAMDVDQLTQICEVAEGKLAVRPATLTRENTPKKRKIQTEPKQTVSTRFLGADLTEVEQSSSSFDGFELCVLHTVLKTLKADLERKIASNGGSVVRNPTQNTHCVVAENEKNIRVRSVIKAGKYDVLKLSWLERCLRMNKVLPFAPEDIIFATAKTKEELTSRFDQYGDEYDAELGGEDLSKLFSTLPADDNSPKNLDPQSIRAVQTTINTISSRYSAFGFHDLPTSVFLGLHFYVNDKLILNDPTTTVNSLESREIRSLVIFFSGVLDEQLTQRTTHCIFIPTEVPQGSMEAITEYRGAARKKFHIISADWVRRCVDAGSLVPEKQYEYKKS